MLSIMKWSLKSKCSDQINYLLFAILVLIIHHLAPISCLRIRKLGVPSAVRNGSAVYLSCDYELVENESLYSVKWYKDRVEFYCFLPGNEPYPGQVFRLSGIHVDLHASNSSHVLLFRMELESEGTYSCEVSTDQFITAVAFKKMKIYVVPQEKLRIEGSEFEYNVGHLINLTCICPYSKPAAQLSWFINGKRAPSNLLVKHIISKQNSLESVKLGLVFQTRRSDFINDQLTLKCVASIVLSYSFETSQELDDLKNTNIGYQSQITSGLASSTTSSDLIFQQKEAPVIKGLRSSYRVGDLLNLNCSTIVRDSQLKWYINNEPVNSNFLVYYTLPLTSLNYSSPNAALNQTQSNIYESTPQQLSNVYHNTGYQPHILRRRMYLNRNEFNHDKHYSSFQHEPIVNYQILGLQMPLKQQHFQTDVRLKCVVSYVKHVAKFEQSLNIVTENHHLLQATSSTKTANLKSNHWNGMIFCILLFLEIVTFFSTSATLKK